MCHINNKITALRQRARSYLDQDFLFRDEKNVYRDIRAIKLKSICQRSGETSWERKGRIVCCVSLSIDNEEYIIVYADGVKATTT